MCCQNSLGRGRGSAGVWGPATVLRVYAIDIPAVTIFAFNFLKYPDAATERATLNLRVWRGFFFHAGRLFGADEDLNLLIFSQAPAEKTVFVTTAPTSGSCARRTSRSPAQPVLFFHPLATNFAH